MANKKFSEFTVKTSTSDVDFVVGYDGTDNVRITPANLTGGGGASSLNGLTDCLADATNNFIGNVPASVSSAIQNTSLGIDALETITSGSFNVGIGFAACKPTTGSKNTGVGRSALGNLDTSSGSTAVGYQAGFISTAGDSVYVGNEPGRANTATGHISIGYQAGYSNTSGIQNTNLGFEAGYSNTANAFRTCIGWKAGKLNTGTGNTFIGNNAGADRANVEGSSTAVGNSAGRYWESGSNTALGEGAGQYANGTSRYNVMVGRDALGGAFGSKSNNVAVGYKAGYAATTGESNTLIGYEAGLAITTAGKNVLMGYQSGKSLVAGSNSGSNVFVGYQTGFGANNANYNTLLGYQTGYGLTNGENNTIIGSFASAYGGALTTGDNNTIIGNAAYPSAATVSNEITLGNSGISALRCAVTSITSLSDERDKSDIKDITYGLAFIDALQPREFVWDNRPEIKTEIDEDGNKTEVEFYSANKGKKDFGFIAQEVKELDNDTLRLVYDENPEKLELSYGKLVPVLVQAIKELKAEIELLKS